MSEERWEEKFPKTIPWDEVPEERRKYTETTLAKNPGKNRCKMGLDTGNIYGTRTGVYTQCQIVTAPGEVYCYRHGGAKMIKEKKPYAPRYIRSLEKRKKQYMETLRKNEETLRYHEIVGRQIERDNDWCRERLAEIESKLRGV